ncbi:MAG: hypothetical protein SVV80_08485 [Planctomycetota bacterium]|nr:hypothetical protein [Planctomycetota bacterium]
MGSGSTIAAAAACGLKSVGLESNPEFFAMAKDSIPKLAAYKPGEVNGNGSKR